MKQLQEITKLGFYLNRAFAGIVEDLDHGLHEAGLPINHARFLILKTLEKNPGEPMSQRSIAIKLGKDPAAISRTLKLLEADGLIKRSAVNGCKNGVILTEKYSFICPQVEAVIKKVTSEYCSGLSEEEISGGVIFLQKVLEKRLGDNSRK